MFKTYVGDIFKSGCQTLVNPVNCVGFMGKGLALEFKNRYPIMFDDYRKRCEYGGLEAGKPYVYKGSSPWILNFPTKNDWRNNSEIQYVADGLLYLLEHYKEWGITSLAIPALGCGLGGLDVESVWDQFKVYLPEMDIRVDVFVTEKMRREIIDMDLLIVDGRT